MTSNDTAIARPSIRATIREALHGSAQDFTQGPLGRAVVLLAIPMVVEMAMESIFAVTDIFFVSRLGAASVAAVGLTESLLAIVYALAMGLGTAVTAVVARRIGEKEPESAAHAAAQGVGLGICVALVLGSAGAFFAPSLLRLMGAGPDVLAVGTGFTRVMLGGEASVILLFLLNAAFRGAGDAAIAMRVLIVSNGINILLGPCLIFGVGPFPRLGVTGAAIATTIGRGTGALIAFLTLVRGDHRLRVTRRQFVPDLAQMTALVRLAGSATFQFIIGTASWIGLVRIISLFGSVALAGYTIAIRLLIFALLPAWGLANAAATLVGQNLGAGHSERAEASVWVACRYNLIFLSALGVIFVALAPELTGFFGHDADVAHTAAVALRIMALGFPFYAFGMVVMQAFNGAGDTWTPTWLNLLTFWCWEIPLAWVLARPLGWNETGGFVAIPIAFSTMAAVGALLFRRGRWKLQRV
ncbi:MAG TPA: MATE family efflux transporter [Gemmatimonadales bacterium]|nr:MATE family efflux transporter [Gemmatimonadales bacterium]